MGNRIGLSLLSLSVIVLAAFSITPAFAGVPSCTLFDIDPGAGVFFGGIEASSFTCFIDDNAKTITINEKWIGTADSYIIFDNLMTGQIRYTVTKTITNSLPNGEKMTSFSHELHDPTDGGTNDGLDGPCDDPLTGDPNDLIPDLCPTGYTRSNDADGLSFAQEDPNLPPTIPRTSIEFPPPAADEFGLIDFIDFLNGDICNTAVPDNAFCTGPDFDVESFGIRDNDRRGGNQPFLLRETLTPIAPPMIGGEIVLSDFTVLPIAGMNDNAFNILGILSLVGVSTFAALYFTVKRK